jgi:hypothetical protein
MNITVTRKWFTALSTIGELECVNEAHGPFHCFTLEPPKKDPPAKPRCIPTGSYEVTWRFSPNHGFWVPAVENVPDFADIEIHPGNFQKDTEGCLLVAESRGNPIQGGSDCILNSKPIFARLAYDYIKPAIDAKERVWITYLEKPE